MTGPQTAVTGPERHPGRAIAGMPAIVPEATARRRGEGP
jgi:hypothetical protein